MRRREGLHAAQMEALRLRRRCGVVSTEHLRLDVIAAHCGATIDTAPMEGALAQLVRRGRKVQILLADHLTDPAAQRFSIAHELGHLVLGHPTPPGITAVMGSPVPTTERSHEEEANAFAAELLMPADWLRQRCEAGPVGLDVPRQISRELGVSILASAIRFVELTSHPCAAVLSRNQVVRWVAATEAFPHAIVRGRVVPSTTAAGAFFATGRAPDEPQRVSAADWVEAPAGGVMVEHAAGSQELGTVISMIWPEGSDGVCSGTQYAA